LRLLRRGGRRSSSRGPSTRARDDPLGRRVRARLVRRLHQLTDGGDLHQHGCGRKSGGLSKDDPQRHLRRMRTPMRVATWNINGIKARHGVLVKWLEANSPDIVALQEIKIVDADFPRLELEAMGYNVETFGQKSWNGV